MQGHLLNAAPQNDWKTIRPRVGSLMEAGRKDEAIQLLTGLIAQHPNAPELHAQLGMVYYQLKDYETALPHVSRAVQLNEGSLEYSMNLAEVLLASRRFPTAVEFLSAVQHRFRGNVPFHYNLGLALYGARDFASSLHQFREVSRIAPSLAQGHYFQANCLAAMGEYSPAEAAYRKALQLRPDDPACLFALGKLLQLAGPDRLSDSISTLEQSVKLDPTHTPSLFYLSLAYEKAQRYDQARVILEDITARQPDRIEPHAALARIYYRLKMRDRGDAAAATVRRLRDQAR
jgi:tetratricopeptide (TPR) repeat protein